MDRRAWWATVYEVARVGHDLVTKLNSEQGESWPGHSQGGTAFPHNISLGHHHAPAPTMLYPESDLDWRFDSYMIVYMLQCGMAFSIRRDQCGERCYGVRSMVAEELKKSQVLESLGFDWIRSSRDKDK